MPSKPSDHHQTNVKFSMKCGNFQFLKCVTWQFFYETWQIFNYNIFSWFGKLGVRWKKSAPREHCGPNLEHF